METERVFVPTYPSWSIVFQRDENQNVVSSPMARLSNTQVSLELIGNNLIINKGGEALLVPKEVLRLLEDYRIAYDSYLKNR